MKNKKLLICALINLIALFMPFTFFLDYDFGSHHMQFMFATPFMSMADGLSPYGIGFNSNEWISLIVGIVIAFSMLVISVISIVHIAKNKKTDTVRNLFVTQLVLNVLMAYVMVVYPSGFYDAYFAQFPCIGWVASSVACLLGISNISVDKYTKSDNNLLVYSFVSVALSLLPLTKQKVFGYESSNTWSEFDYGNLAYIGVGDTYGVEYGIIALLLIVGIVIAALKLRKIYAVVNLGLIALCVYVIIQMIKIEDVHRVHILPGLYIWMAWLLFGAFMALYKKRL